MLLFIRSVILKWDSGNIKFAGQIDCPTVGSCQVFGEGTIDVVPNGVYYMVWQNTALGQCSAIYRPISSAALRLLIAAHRHPGTK